MFGDAGVDEDAVECWGGEVGERGAEGAEVGGVGGYVAGEVGY